MAVICPTITPLNEAEYNAQMMNIASLSGRMQIDLMDKEFANSESTVVLDDVWWPPANTVDIHLMYKNPFDFLEILLRLKPSMVIIHVEAMIHHMHFAAELHKEGIKAGLAILPETPVSNVEQILHSFDHLLIFSGNLGYFGGEANLELAGKAYEAKAHHPELEVGWDGGINSDNAKILSSAGVDVLNVGGFIQNSDDPQSAYDVLLQAIE